MFGKRIKELRKAAGLNQADLAAKLGVSRPNISFWEHSQYPPLEAVVKICGVLNTDVSEFFLSAEAKSQLKGTHTDIHDLAERLASLPPDALSNILDIFSVILEKQELMYKKTLPDLLDAYEPVQKDTNTIMASEKPLSGHEDSHIFHHRLPYYARYAGKIALEQYFHNLAWLSN